MKWKEIILLPMIGVVIMMLTACASSSGVSDMSHQEVTDRMRTEQTDSVSKTVEKSDSVQENT